MSFEDDMRRIVVEVVANVAIIFNNTASHMHRSIQEGSSVTGSPGQPVANVGGGNLRTSWQLNIAPDGTEAVISTNSPYARSNEDGVARPGGGQYLQRSSVGGRFSIALTIASIDKIVAYETEKILGKG